MVGELTIALCHLLSERAVAVQGEVEALIREVDVQTYGKVGVRVADHGLVVVALVDLAVAVHVDELHVARLQRLTLQRVGLVAAAVAVQVVLKVLLVLNDTLHLVAPEVTDWESYLNAVELGCVLCDGV